MNCLDAVATIASGASLSGAIALGNAGLLYLEMPAAWTAADLSFQVSSDGTNFFDYFYPSGGGGGTEVEYVIGVSASRAYTLTLLDFAGVKFVKLRSGTTGTPVNQGAARSIRVRALL